MEKVFSKFEFPGKYHSLTPGHKNELTQEAADKMRTDHFLFNDMTTDNHLTSSGVSNDWPYGRGIWLSDDRTKMIWVGEEDQLRIISIVQGNDLGIVDASLRNLLTAMENSGIEFAEHPTYGVITTCPTNMGTGKRQSILGQFPNITKRGTDEKALKELAKSFGLQARGMGGEHSAMDENGTADISPSARFGVTEAFVAQKLFEGLKKLYAVELENARWSELKFGNIVYQNDARKLFLSANGNVDWDKVQQRFDDLKPIKESLASKYFTPEVRDKVKNIPQ